MVDRSRHEVGETIIKREAVDLESRPSTAAHSHSVCGRQQNTEQLVLGIVQVHQEI